ncbi:hypothetical protein CANMA_000926 [Candida margitis]|uniref:uncharacterized protein n=1 Tax=Candida margitis TaxID=1775924 RepID=UPI002227A902|nr:uncharacterized protein CANMA_000926 [Candida margitis]KAI5970023.1 hypothetical protein CANMA_000926 [Candida margitis]
MSSTPSPTKRSVLSPKIFNANQLSPQRKNFAAGPKYANKSPMRSGSQVRTPSPKKPKPAASLGFTIWEDNVDNTSHDVVGTPTSNKANHNDQENILQPKQTCHRSGHRTPLQDLSINSFKGYISSGGVTTQLDDPYQPLHFDNGFRSAHRFNNLPPFVTPVKKDRYLAKSGRVDEWKVEASSVRKHGRSLSVGMNEAKRDLVQKPKFAISAS